MFHDEVGINYMFTMLVFCDVQPRAADEMLKKVNIFSDMWKNGKISYPVKSAMARLATCELIYMKLLLIVIASPSPNGGSEHDFFRGESDMPVNRPQIGHLFNVLVVKMITYLHGLLADF